MPLLWFKGAVFALLLCNVAIYTFSGTLSEALDSVAWLTLLVLFELETDFGERFREGRVAAVMRAIRLAAGAAVCAAAIGYVRDEEWPDAINTGLWIGIVAILEVQVRLARYRAWLGAAGAILYAGLAAMVLVWLWRREWFDAYDALLWLIALLVIESNVLRGARAGRASGV